MRLNQLKRRTTNEHVAAEIISDGCRDYIVAIRQPKGRELVRTWRGAVRRFASLAEAKLLLQRARIRDISLAVRVAADEACAGPAPGDSGFATLKLQTAEIHPNHRRRR
ncbi:MAG: hypothetical protein AAF993_02585 [Pseudomonadota bacterium]